MEKPGARRTKRPGAAGRAAKWKDPQKRQLVRLPNIPRTKVFTVLSLLLLVCLGGILLYDCVQIAFLQHPELTTQQFTVALLIMHLLAIYAGLLPLLYYQKMQVQRLRLIRQALIATVGNILLMILRVIFEIVCRQFREESYVTH